jgi:hypothetical protein
MYCSAIRRPATKAGRAIRSWNQYGAGPGRSVPAERLSQSALRDAIIKERMHEFVFEQQMYPELRRKSTPGGQPDYLGDQIRQFSTKYNVGRTPKKQDYVLPIPLKEIQGNPNVKQNPEWQ